MAKLILFALVVLIVLQSTWARDELESSNSIVDGAHSPMVTQGTEQSTPLPADGNGNSGGKRHPHDLHIEELFEKARIFPKELEKAQQRFHEAWKFKDLFPKRESKLADE